MNWCDRKMTWRILALAVGWIGKGIDCEADSWKQLVLWKNKGSVLMSEVMSDGWEYELDIKGKHQCHRSRLLSLKHMDTILNYGDHWNHPQSRWRSINMKSEVFWCLKVRRDWERMITKIFREIIIKTVFQERKKRKNDFIYFLWAWSYKDLEVSIGFDQ